MHRPLQGCCSARDSERSIIRVSKRGHEALAVPRATTTAQGLAYKREGDVAQTTGGRAESRP